MVNNYVGDQSYIGDLPRIEQTLNTGLVGATAVYIYINRPSGDSGYEEIIRTGGIMSETTGIVYYDSVSGDILTSGVFYYQFQVVLAGGKAFKSKTREWIYAPDYK